MTPAAAWQRTYDILQTRLAKHQFDTWLKESAFLRCEGSTYVIGVPTAHVANWLNRELRNTILRTLAQVTFVGDVNVAFEVDAALGRRQAPRPLRLPARSDPLPNADGRFTFDAFIPYSHNQDAIAAAHHISADTSPLLIQAAAGLGKTHLLYAIAHLWQPALVHTGDTFTAEQVEAERPSILLIDNIHHISRDKTSTMRTLFRNLTANNIPIVATSDRPAAMLATALPWLNTITIRPPDFYQRQHILRAKAAARGITLPADMGVAIAKYANQSIRSLDDALNKIAAYAMLANAPIDRQLIQVALSDLLPTPVHLTIADIIEAVSQHYHVTTASLLAGGRARTIVYPRQVIMYLARTETNASFQEIGRYLGNRDHSTVLHGYEKIAEMVERNESIRRDILAIRTHLYETLAPTK